MTIHETPANPVTPLADVLRGNVLKSIDEARKAQACAILDALDKLVGPGHAWAAGIDAHGVAWVRHEIDGTFRGSSMRDAFAQLLAARGVL
jgi:hypothetical protein